MTNVTNPILIDGAYCPKSQKPYPCPPGPVAVLIQNISFDDIKGTATTGRVGDFGCSHVSPCENIKLSNVQLATLRSGAKAEFMCSDAHGPPAVSTIPSSCISSNGKASHEAISVEKIVSII